MKKNIAMRVAAFLFILTMISTCAFATTFAKYTTSGSATDEARVAKWGVTVVVTGDDAFDTDYATHDTTKYTGANSVSATGTGSSRENLVAPGTKGTLLTYNISGTPEVATEITVDFDLTLTGWVIDYNNGTTDVADEFYCPLVFKLGSTVIDTTGCSDASAFEAAVEAAISAAYNNAANVNLAKSVVLSWEWAFSTSSLNDIKDTALGDLGTAPTIEFEITVTVTQID